MKHLLKFLLKAALTLCVVFIIVASLLITFINPNHFKPVLQAQISQALGRNTVINGDIDWQFLPTLGLNAHKVIIDNPQGFSRADFATIQSLAFKIKTLPLIKGNIIIPEISMKEPSIHFEINRQEHNNWQDLAGAKATSTQKVHSSYFHLETIKINKFTIEDGIITVNNRSTRQTLAFSDVNASTKNILSGKAFPIQLRFSLRGSEPRDDKTVTLASNNQLQGQLSVDIPAWEKQQRLLPAIDFQGDMQVDDFHFDKLTIPELTSHISIKQQLISFSPIQAQLYEGKASGQFQIDMRKDSPVYNLKASMAKLDAAKFFNAMIDVDRITGRADLAVELQSAGKTADALTKNLQGKAKYHFTNGVLKGVDIPLMIDIAVAVFNKKTLQTRKAQGTNFGDISGSLVINNGVITNPDFKMSSSAYLVDGKGTVNLNNKRVNYRISAKAQITKAPIISQIQTTLGGEFPIIITGTWDNLQVTPDIPALITARAKGLLKKGLETIIDNPATKGTKDLIRNIFQRK